MHDLGILRDLVVILAVGLFVVSILRRLHVPAIAGYILAGVLVGPGVLGLVSDVHQVELLAEVGVVLLLFGIGLELSFSRIRSLWKAVLFGGSIQVGLTLAGTAGISVATGMPAGSAIFLGCVVAVSSTAVVLRGLALRGEIDAPHGRLAVGILVFQDLCVVPMILSIPFLRGGGDTGQALVALATAVGVLLAVVVGAQIVVPRLLAAVARTRQRDLFVLAVFLVCFGTAWAVTGAGISLALGAFLGGLVVAGSEYRHQAMAELVPIREALASVFFVSVGMLLDPVAIVRDAAPIAALLVAIVLGKFLLVFATALLLRLPFRVSILTGTALAQVGEFSFVLLRAAGAGELVPEPLGSQLLVAIILSMAVTPLFLAFGPHLAAGAARVPILERLMRVSSPEPRKGPDELRGHVIVAGYGLAGRRIAHALREVGKTAVVLDLNPGNVRRAIEDGHRAFYGDAASPEVLEILGVEEAAEFVVAVNDPQGALRAVRSARAHAPKIPILARAAYATDVESYRRAGVDRIVVAEEAAAGELSRQVLLGCGVPEAEATTAVRGPDLEDGS